jgi:hypothetical protein
MSFLNVERESLLRNRWNTVLVRRALVQIFDDVARSATRRFFFLQWLDSLSLSNLTCDGSINLVLLTVVA